jgi:transposase InsO family protein
MEVTVAFIDDHRKTYGVEPIFGVLPIGPSTYFRHKAHQPDPTRRSARAQRDDELRAIIRRIWNEHHQAYGPRKVWRQMGRERLRAARCRVRRLMWEMGLAGATRGRAWVTTTEAAPVSEWPADLVDRQFTATRPNCSNPSATCRRPNAKRAIMSRLRRPDSHNPLSDDPGTIHLDTHGRPRHHPRRRRAEDPGHLRCVRGRSYNGDL